MKGDFSRFEQPDQVDSAILVQQGRPLLDSQINAAVMTLLRNVEGSLALQIPAIQVPDGKLTHDDKSITFPSRRMFVSARQAHIADPFVVDSEDETGSKATIDEVGKLFGHQVAAGVYVLYSLLVEEAVSHQVTDDAVSNFVRFADPAVPSSDSLRLRRFVHFGLAPDADWQTKKDDFDNREQQTLTVTHLEAAPTSAHFRFQYARSSDQNGNKFVELKWSRDNAALIFPIETTATTDNTIQIPGLAKSNLDVRVGQHVELLGDFPHTPHEHSTLPQVVEIKEVHSHEKTLVLKGPLTELSKKAVLAQIWEGRITLTPGDGNDADKLTGTHSGFSVELPQAEYLHGDYWQLPVRVGHLTTKGIRQSSRVDLEAVCKVTIVDGPKIAALTEIDGLDVVASRRLRGAQTENVAALDSIHDVRIPSEDPNSVLAETPCRDLFPEVKTLPVRQWLASISWAELHQASDEQLQRRIACDCEGKPCDKDDFQRDLDIIVQKRRRLREGSGIVIA